jgi:hypothetical protein
MEILNEKRSKGICFLKPEITVILLFTGLVLPEL